MRFSIILSTTLNKCFLHILFISDEIIMLQKLEIAPFVFCYFWKLPLQEGIKTLITIIIIKFCLTLILTLAKPLVGRVKFLTINCIMFHNSIYQVTNFISLAILNLLKSHINATISVIDFLNR